MKYRNTKILLLLSLFFFSLSQTFAVMQPQTSYKSYEAFQASGDAPICQVVTDGCNEWTFTDGEKTDPIKLCKLTSDFVYSWSCAEYQDGIMFLQGGADTMYTDPLTTQERALYQTLQAQLTENELTKVSKVTEKYMQFYNTYSKIKQEKFAAKIQTFIQKHIDIRST